MVQELQMNFVIKDIKRGPEEESQEDIKRIAEFFSDMQRSRIRIPTGQLSHGPTGPSRGRARARAKTLIKRMRPRSYDAPMQKMD